MQMAHYKSHCNSNVSYLSQKNLLCSESHTGLYFSSALCWVCGYMKWDGIVNLLKLTVIPTL